ncbi:Cytochrome c oxidase polypeptide III [Rhodovulum sp. PH10]|uniref:cytochrome c oxidase subunit 3 n=1 Tax=Rhodovulum sp. PH10 TaxID=1187851 RepID=UPI00027C2A0B|nr:cytochrome c oxidase subunit 3 [Rhodovulum sp. PH10]EJW12525.1 Cytochrome c oxidase polypeptide III [Rhodovulum sp. PH10]
MSDTEILQEPWARVSRQREGATFGIWVFLATEALFFGALFLTYAIGRIENPAGFVAAGRETDVFYGTLNTAILLTSSLTMAVASQAAAEGEAALHRLVVWCLGATVLLALAFLVVKGFEYREDVEKHLVPGRDFAIVERGAQIFFALYWIITGVHAIHVSVGIVLISRLWIMAATRRMKVEKNPQIEVAGLYWHFVDIVWIFVYPLIYLPGRATG